MPMALKKLLCFFEVKLRLIGLQFDLLGPVWKALQFILHQNDPVSVHMIILDLDLVNWSRQERAAYHHFMRIFGFWGK